MINALYSDLTTSNAKQKIGILRKAFSEMEKIDRSSIGENILDTGVKICTKLNIDSNKFNVKIKKLIDYRNKTIIHPSEENPQFAYEDNRDFREISKIFIKGYLKIFYELDINLKDDPVKEDNSYYYSAFHNSTIK